MKPSGLWSRFKVVLIPLLIVLVTVLLVWMLARLKPTPPEKAAEEQTWPIQTITVKAAERSPQLQLLGRVETPYRSNLTSAVTADVASLLVLEGQTVRKGDVIVKLDASEVALTVDQRNADVQELEAQLAKENNQYDADQAFVRHEQALLDIANRALAREQKLSRSKLTSESRIDEARQARQTAQLSLLSRKLAVANHDSQLKSINARLNRARALLAQARLDLQRTEVRAPFDGTVITVAVSPGERVRAGEPLAGLYASDKLEIRAQIPMRWLSDARQALAGATELTATTELDGTRYNLELGRLSGQVSQGAGGIDGLFRFRDDAPPVALNRTLELRVDLAPRQRTFAIPVAALYDETTIYRVADSRLQPIEVTLEGSRFQNGRQQLLVQSDQLNTGDAILSTQLPNAIAGLKVDVVNSGAPQ